MIRCIRRGMAAGDRNRIARTIAKKRPETCGGEHGRVPVAGRLGHLPSLQAPQGRRPATGLAAHRPAPGKWRFSSHLAYGGPRRAPDAGRAQPEEAGATPRRQFVSRGGYFLSLVHANERHPPRPFRPVRSTSVCPPTGHFSTKGGHCPWDFRAMAKGAQPPKQGGKRMAEWGGGGVGSRAAGPPPRRAPARHGPQPASTATYFRHGFRESFFLQGKSKRLHLRGSGVSPLLSTWAPLPCSRLRDMSGSGAKKKASSTPRDSQAVPRPSTNRALRRLTAEFGRGPVYSTRYGRWRET